MVVANFGDVLKPVVGKVDSCGFLVVSVFARDVEVVSSKVVGVMVVVVRLSEVGATAVVVVVTVVGAIVIVVVVAIVVVEVVVVVGGTVALTASPTHLRQASVAGNRLLSSETSG